MPSKNKFGLPPTGRCSAQLTRCYVRLQNLTRALADESGQDLIEYALVVALIALGATVSMAGVAASISSAFTSVSTRISTYTS